MLVARKFWLGLCLAALLVSTTLARPDADPGVSKWLAQDAEFTVVLNIKQALSSKLVGKNGLEAIKAADEGEYAPLVELHQRYTPSGEARASPS